MTLELVLDDTTFMYKSQTIFCLWYNLYMIDTVFFDWGGVIAQDPGDDFLKEILRERGASERLMEEINQKYMQKFMRGEFTEHDYWQALKHEYGFEPPVSTGTTFLSWQGTETIPAAIDLVRDVQASGRTAAILSNVIMPAYSALYDAGVYDEFDVVITSCTEGVAKPEPEIFQLALERAIARAGNSLFIDDKEHNIDIAKQLGFHTILAKHPSQYVAEARILLNLTEPTSGFAKTPQLQY